MKEILISGYYGFGNSGDDALLLSIINDFQSKDLKKYITVLSANPSETKRIYGVNAANRLNPFSLVYHFVKARLFVSGGGTLIQDGTSTKSLIYYLSLIRFAKLLGKKVMLYANGIGPVTKEKNRIRVKKILSKTDVITVRDEKSYHELEKLGVSGPEIFLTADPVFMLDNKENIDNLIEKYNLKNIMCVSVRTVKEMNEEEFARAVSSALDYAKEKYGKMPVLLPLQQRDTEISKKIVNNMTESAVIIKEKLSVAEVLSLVAHSDLCIGMRLHMLIYAACGAVPVIGIVYDPKVSGFMEYARQDLYIDINNLTDDSLKRLIDECMESLDAREKSLMNEREKLKGLSGKNIEKAYRLYKGEI